MLASVSLLASSFVSPHGLIASPKCAAVAPCMQMGDMPYSSREYGRDDGRGDGLGRQAAGFFERFLNGDRGSNAAQGLYEPSFDRGYARDYRPNRMAEILENRNRFYQDDPYGDGSGFQMREGNSFDRFGAGDTMRREMPYEFDRGYGAGYGRNNMREFLMRREGFASHPEDYDAYGMGGYGGMGGRGNFERFGDGLPRRQLNSNEPNYEVGMRSNHFAPMRERMLEYDFGPRPYDPRMHMGEPMPMRERPYLGGTTPGGSGNGQSNQFGPMRGQYNTGVSRGTYSNRARDRSNEVLQGAQW